MIKEDAVTVAFHKLELYNCHGGHVVINDEIKDIIKIGLLSLKVTTLEDKKKCFEEYHLYVNEIQEETSIIYCRISDSRYGYPEDIYKDGSNEQIETSANDIRSKKFFMSLDFSNEQYILVSNQYLGNNGCYMAIEKSIKKILTNAGYKIVSNAIVNKGELREYFQQGGIKSFEVTRFEEQADIADNNGFSKKCTVSLSPTTRSRSGMNRFYNKVHDIFLGEDERIHNQEYIAKRIVQESGLNAASVRYDGVDGIDLAQYRVKVISKYGQYDLINQDGTMATRYDISHCEKDPDGNPNFEDIKNKTNEIKRKIQRSID